MNYHVKIHVSVEQENGSGLPKQEFVKIRVTAPDAAEAARQFNVALQKYLDE